MNSQKSIVELQKALDEEMSNPLTDDNLFSSINHKLLLAYKAEEKFWRQRSRQMWLVLGDRNTSYFHASTKSRRARNRMSIIEDSEGNPVHEEDK